MPDRVVALLAIVLFLVLVAACAGDSSLEGTSGDWHETFGVSLFEGNQAEADQLGSDVHRKLPQSHLVIPESTRRLGSVQNGSIDATAYGVVREDGLVCVVVVDEIPRTDPATGQVHDLTGIQLCERPEFFAIRGIPFQYGEHPDAFGPALFAPDALAESLSLGSIDGNSNLFSMGQSIADFLENRRIASGRT